MTHTKQRAERHNLSARPTMDSHNGAEEVYYLAGRKRAVNRMGARVPVLSAQLSRTELAIESSVLDRPVIVAAVIII